MLHLIQRRKGRVILLTVWGLPIFLMCGGLVFAQYSAAADTLILFFGWLGCNASSPRAASPPRFSVTAINTLLAGAAGAGVALYYTLAEQV